jgi:ZIP family zinc transporter
MLLATIEDLVPEADKPGTRRTISTASFVGGFAFFTLLAQYVG